MSNKNYNEKMHHGNKKHQKMNNKNKTNNKRKMWKVKIMKSENVDILTKTLDMKNNLWLIT